MPADQPLCISVIIMLALAPILWALFRRFPSRVDDDDLTPEQVDAVVRQGNALGLAFFFNLLVAGSEYFGARSFLAAKEAVMLLGGIVLALLQTVIGIYLGVSAIRYQVFWFRNRGSRKYPRGGAAIGWGVAVLLAVVVGWYLLLVKVLGR